MSLAARLFSGAMNPREGCDMPVARMTSFLALIALLAVFGCEDGGPAVRDPRTVASLVVAPESVAIDQSASSQFTAYGRTIAGESLATAVTWSTTRGTITAQGLYTA